MKTILAIPGLGGHVSVFKRYAAYLPEYRLACLDYTSFDRGNAALREAIKNSTDKVIVLANCYGAIPVLRNLAEFAPRIERLVIIEPFFAEFKWWQSLARIVIHIALRVSLLTDRWGLTRKRLHTDIDYVRLSKYPIYIQPFFDIQCQTTTEYLKKLSDIFTFRLPAEISIPTLFIFSPGGFTKSADGRRNILNHFSEPTVVQAARKTHNIVTVSDEEITALLQNWLAL